MLLTAIGEGINRIKRSLPEFLESTYPDIPWKAIVGMRNHIAHGYFELDAEIVYETVSTNIPSLHDAIKEAISELKHWPKILPPFLLSYVKFFSYQSFSFDHAADVKIGSSFPPISCKFLGA